MSRAWPLGLILLAGIASAADAQPRPLRVGDEVRILVRGVISPLEGTLLSADDGPLTLRTEDGAELSIPRDQVERSEYLGSRPNTLRGALVGAGAGLAVGVAILIDSRNDCSGTRNALGFCNEVGESVDQLPLVIGPLVGAGVGALVGSVISTGVWFPGVLPSPSETVGSGLAFMWSIPLGR